MDMHSGKSQKLCLCEKVAAKQEEVRQTLKLKEMLPKFWTRDINNFPKLS